MPKRPSTECGAGEQEQRLVRPEKHHRVAVLAPPPGSAGLPGRGPIPVTASHRHHPPFPPESCPLAESAISSRRNPSGSVSPSACARKVARIAASRFADWRHATIADPYSRDTSASKSTTSAVIAVTASSHSGHNATCANSASQALIAWISILSVGLRRVVSVWSIKWNHHLHGFGDTACASFPVPDPLWRAGHGTATVMTWPFPQSRIARRRRAIRDWPRRVQSRWCARHMTHTTHSARKIQRSVYRATQGTRSLRSAHSARVFGGHDHSSVMLRSLTSLPAADLSGTALIAPLPSTPGGAPTSAGAASPAGAGETLLADDGSLTGHRATGAALPHPHISQRLSPPQYRRDPSLSGACRVHSTTAHGYPLVPGTACSHRTAPISFQG